MPVIPVSYKYINFVLQEKKVKTQVWRCENTSSGDELGIVKWYGPWRRYCYFPSGPAVYSAGCLKDITHFIEQLMAAREAPRDWSTPAQESHG